MARKRSSQQKALLQGRLAKTAPGPSSAHCPSARSRMASQQQHALGTIEGGISIDTHVRRKHQASTSVRRIHIRSDQAPAPPQPTRTQPTRMARQLATTYSIATPQAPSGACVCVHTSCCITVSTCITCPNSARQCSNSPPPTGTCPTPAAAPARSSPASPIPLPLPLPHWPSSSPCSPRPFCPLCPLCPC